MTSSSQLDEPSLLDAEIRQVHQRSKPDGISTQEQLRCLSNLFESCQIARTIASKFPLEMEPFQS